LRTLTISPLACSDAIYEAIQNLKKHSEVTIYPSETTAYLARSSPKRIPTMLSINGLPRPAHPVCPSRLIRLVSFAY
jgi:hypothetical protein